jgi:hypothetical protein
MESQIIFKSLGTIKPKGQNRKAKVGQEMPEVEES